MVFNMKITFNIDDTVMQRLHEEATCVFMRPSGNGWMRPWKTVECSSST